MKILIILSLAIFSPTTNAAEIPQPFDICSGFSCPEGMKTFRDEFQNAGVIHQEMIPFVASGECYHRGGYLNATIAHHGVVLLDNKNESTYSGGSFSFFYKEDPYAAWTPELVREKNPRMYEENHKVIFKENFAFVDMNPGGPAANRVNYWYRQNSNTFYLLGAWGIDHTFVCRFPIHP